MYALTVVLVAMACVVQAHSIHYHPGRRGLLEDDEAMDMVVPLDAQQQQETHKASHTTNGFGVDLGLPGGHGIIINLGGHHYRHGRKPRHNYPANYHDDLVRGPVVGDYEQLERRSGGGSGGGSSSSSRGHAGLPPAQPNFVGDPLTKPVAVTDPRQAGFEAVEHVLKPHQNCGAHGQPIHTNKFYTNFLVGERAQPVFAHPYTLRWSNSREMRGMGVVHASMRQRVFGPADAHGGHRFLVNAHVQAELNLGAAEFSSAKCTDFDMYTSGYGPLSVDVAMTGAGASMQMPVAIGMGLVTALYHNATPEISSAAGFLKAEKAGELKNGMHKYILELRDHRKWVMYVKSPAPLNFKLDHDGSRFVADSNAAGGGDNGHRIVVDHGNATGAEGNESDDEGYDDSDNDNDDDDDDDDDEEEEYDEAAQEDGTRGPIIIQVATLPEEVPLDVALPVYDAAAGTYPQTVTISSQVNAAGAFTYALNYNVKGRNANGAQTTLLFALPHHAASLVPGTVTRPRFKVDTTVFGKAVAVLGARIAMLEQMPAEVGFLPASFDPRRLDTATKLALNASVAHEMAAAEGELHAAIAGASAYDVGKMFDKHATIAFTARYVQHDMDAARRGLARMKHAMETYLAQAPLVYDSTWKGVVTRVGLRDFRADYGNGFYSDHHFHYGYFVHAAALVATLDHDLDGGAWTRQHLRDHVDTLVRDVANPAGADGHFPQWRMFDWYTGKSWAQGLFSTEDGKDEESSSEDYHFWYGMKLWARVVRDAAMETRAGMALAITKRAINSYMLYASDNAVMPRELLPNKVSGILFDAKIDYTTYFGNRPEYIHGIHMLPITPASRYIRSPRFCNEEYEQKVRPLLQPGASVDYGWTGLLRLGQALTTSAPHEALRFFQNEAFDYRCLVRGMSRTWSLVMAAGLAMAS